MNAYRAIVSARFLRSISWTLIGFFGVSHGQSAPEMMACLRSLATAFADSCGLSHCLRAKEIPETRTHKRDEEFKSQRQIYYS